MLSFGAWGLSVETFDIFHRFLLTPRQQELFERIALYCDKFTNTNFIPVLFVLGKSDWIHSAQHELNLKINVK